MTKIEFDKSKLEDSFKRPGGTNLLPNAFEGTSHSALDYLGNPFFSSGIGTLTDPSKTSDINQAWSDAVSGSVSGLGKFWDDAVSGAGVLLNGNDLTRPTARSSSGSSSSSGGHSAESVYSSPVTPSQLNYLNAEIASHYGMSKETAYQEALANTAYQRSVKDMQAAGLNPAVIYGAGKGSPADGVYGARSLDSGGGSGGSSRRYSGSSSNNGKLFTKGQFYGISAAAGLAAAVVSGNPNSYWIGQTVAQGFMTAADSFFGK